jgi:hypothetical protein
MPPPVSAAESDPDLAMPTPPSIKAGWKRRMAWCGGACGRRNQVAAFTLLAAMALRRGDDLAEEAVNRLARAPATARRANSWLG